MYCSNCGAYNHDDAPRCVRCGTPIQAAPQQPRAPQMPGAPTQPSGAIPNYLAHAILCTIFCCLPFGIVAIVFAAQVGTKQTLGDFQGALEASNSARTWCWWAFGVGLFVDVIIVAIQIAAVASRAQGF